MGGLDRAVVGRRLVALEQAGRLGVEQVELAAGGLGVSPRSVWRWVRQARAGEGLSRRPHGRFQITDEIRQQLAFWRGNPHRVGHCKRCGTEHDQSAAVIAYTRDLANDPDLLTRARTELAGQDLACMCPPSGEHIPATATSWSASPPGRTPPLC